MESIIDFEKEISILKDRGYVLNSYNTGGQVIGHIWRHKYYDFRINISKNVISAKTVYLVIYASRKNANKTQGHVFESLDKVLGHLDKKIIYDFFGYE